MAWTRDFLRRFRVAASPGAASAVGVPADRVAESAAELEPVFARLAAAQAGAERIRARARQDAAREARRAEERAAAIVATARRRADEERADAALAASRRLDREREQALADADRAAEAVRRAAESRMPAYVDRVVGEVTSLLEGRDEAAAPGP